MVKLALLLGVNAGLGGLSLPALAEAGKPEVGSVAQVAAAGAIADPAVSDAALPDVTVTAQRRETSLQKTPAAVGVVGGTDLEKKNGRGLQDLAGQVAGLDISGSTAPSMGYRSIRGISSGTPGHNSAVALYIDDVYIPRVINSGAFGLPDIERIEVLRGPQGTLYGQNSSAGAIKVISHTPTDEFRSWVSLGLGDYGAKEGKFFVTGALKEGVLFGSFAYSQRERDGVVRNRTLNKDVNEIDTQQARAKLRLVPNNRTDITLSVDALRDRSDNYALSRLNVPGYEWRKRVTYEDKELTVKNTNEGVSLRVAVRLDDHHELKSITAWRNFVTRPDVWSYDGIPDRKYGWQFNLDQQQISQEFQLNGNFDRLNYTTGVTVFREDLKVNRPNWTNNAYNGITTNTDVVSYAVFGQANYKLTDKLGVTVGSRFSKQKDTFSWTSYTSNAALENLGTTSSLDNLHHDTSGWTPKVGFDYQINDQLLTYFTFSEGRKAGGYNVVSGARAVAEIPVEPERVTSYEWGIKSSTFEGRLQTNVALFYNKFEDYQASVRNPIVNGQVVNGSVVANAAKADLYGIELEAVARPVRNLQLRFNATYVESEFKEYLNPTGNANSDYTGKPVPGPRFLASAGFSYQLPLGGHGNLDIYGDVNHRSKELQLANDPKPVEGRTLVNAGAIYTLPDDSWSVSLNVRNLFDKSYALSRTSVPAYNILGETYVEPRTVLLSLRKDFF